MRSQAHEFSSSEHRTPSELDSVAQKRIELFVLTCLKTYGQKFTWDEGVLRAELDGPLAEELQSQSLALVFDRSLLEIYPEASYVTFGSAVLDRLILFLGRSYTTANLAFFGEQCLSGPPERGLPVLGAASRRTEARLVHHREVLFHFKVSLCADETKEVLLPILIDPVTEEADSSVPIEKAVSIGLGGLGQWHRGRKENAKELFLPPEYESLKSHLGKAEAKLGKQAYSLLRMYQVACESLEEKLAPEAAQFDKHLRIRYRQEEKRLIEYYKGRKEEALDPLRRLFRRMAGTKMRFEMARTYQAENRYQARLDGFKTELREAEQTYHRLLNELDDELNWRLQELEAKYNLKVVARLISAAYLWVPRWELLYQVEGPTGGLRQIPASYDVIRGKFVDLYCEHCDTRSNVLWQCSDGQLVCSRCFGRCADCGKELCPDCSEGICHLCGEYLCEDCGQVCTYEPELLVCKTCKDAHCQMCDSILRI